MLICGVSDQRLRVSTWLDKESARESCEAFSLDGRDDVISTSIMALFRRFSQELKTN
jgi:hypothetical protein